MFDCIYCTELPSYNITPSAIKMWPYKKDGLSWGGGTVYYYCIYNFTISVHLKFVLISRVPSLEGNNLVVFYYICVHLTSGLIKGVVSLEGGEFIVILFYYFIASDIWLDKRGGFPWGGRVYCHCILLFHCIRNLSW